MTIAATQPTSDRWLTIADIANAYGKPRSTVLGWFRHGVRGRRLAGLLVGSRWQAREVDVATFFEQLTADAIGATAETPIPDVLTPARRRLKNARVADELRRMGLDPRRLPAPKRKKGGVG